MKQKTVKSVDILMAEDDPEDQLLVEDAFEQAHLANSLKTVTNGEELMKCLRKEPPYENAVSPDLILLDLNMPRKDGREALTEIKGDAKLRRIPVVIMTTSGAEEDILRSYNLGVNSYIRKPVTFEKLIEVVKTFGHYWFEIVKLPPKTQ